jgi:hypothetical protein
VIKLRTKPFFLPERYLSEFVEKINGSDHSPSITLRYWLFNVSKLREGAFDGLLVGWKRNELHFPVE